MPTVTVIQPTIAEEKSRIIRCAAYCRVSSDSEDQINSFMAQLKYYENFLADSETETLINVYADMYPPKMIQFNLSPPGGEGVEKISPP